MKLFKIFVILPIAILILNSSLGQTTSGRSFGKMLQSYYLYKDQDLLEKTIDFVNHTPTDYKRLEPMLTGFFGALFSVETVIKESFKLHINEILKEDIRNLFSYLIITNIDSIYIKTKLSPTYNDMNWSSYFATGNTKYVANIVANLPLDNDRQDLNLFLTGASAKWSLSSNAGQDKGVKAYLTSIKNQNEIISTILEKDPESFKTETVEILKKQKAAGIWN